MAFGACCLLQHKSNRANWTQERVVVNYKHTGQVESSQFSCYVDKASLEFAGIFPSAETAGVHLHSGLLLNHGYLIVCGCSLLTPSSPLESLFEVESDSGKGEGEIQISYLMLLITSFFPFTLLDTRNKYSS